MSSPAPRGLLARLSCDCDPRSSDCAESIAAHLCALLNSNMLQGSLDLSYETLPDFAADYQFLTQRMRDLITQFELRLTPLRIELSQPQTHGPIEIEIEACLRHSPGSRLCFRGKLDRQLRFSLQPSFSP